VNCHQVQIDKQVLNKPNKILLMGNPNVGKSIFFTELTGIHAISSNYAGTTVTFMEGLFSVGKKEYTLIDVPGTYSLAPTSEAEAVAARFMESGAEAVICVLDASNLERNLLLALELRQYNIPVVYTLNLSDVAERRGINVNVGLLAKELGAPVIQTIAVKKQGLNELKKQMEEILNEDKENQNECISCDGCSSCGKGKVWEQSDIWARAKEITRRVVRKDSANLRFIDRLGDNMLKPFPGLPIAALVLAMLLGLVAFGGRALRIPLIMLTDDLIIPFFRNLCENIFAFFVREGGHLCYNYLIYDNGFHRSLAVVAEGGSGAVCGAACLFLNVLIGEYGIFVISFQWIIALILPYVFTFYVGVTFLEDSGYLPRVSVLFDNIMRKLGVQGGSLIHVILALGCAIPAILGSKTATTKKERLMIAAIICFAIPCISQIAALIALMSNYSWWMSVLMVLFALFLFIATALIAGKVLKGKVDPLILEVPNLLMPEPKAYFRKLMIRMKHFLKDAEVPMMIAIVIAAVLSGTGVLAIIANQPQVQLVVSGWLGLPGEAVVALILGIVRREMSVAPLLLLNLTYLQVFVAGVVSLMYIPCLSVFGVVAKEFKIKVAVIIFIGTIFSALLTGGVINQIARLFI
jgi:ferrous iron transport protein B